MIDPLQIRRELFRREDFSFITRHNGLFHEKQDQVLHALMDKSAREVFYGGAAGGAKSWTGAAFFTFMAMNFPGTRYAVGRNKLNDLRQGTKVTFQKVFKEYGLKEGRDFTYNGQDNYFRFSNGSEIVFIEMSYLPSDPMYERYGSKEFTAAWIEEAGEVHSLAFEVLRSRVGRQYNDRYGIAPVIFITSNPKKNWLYRRYYQNYIGGTLPKDIRVILSFAKDNPFVDSSYKENLAKISDKVTRDRLLDGVWDYDNNPNALVDKIAMDALFGNPYADRDGREYITADIARKGSDKIAIFVWQGHSLIEKVIAGKKKVTETAEIIRNLMLKHNIPTYQVVADEDGVGGGVVDILGIQGFHNGSKAVNGENYMNLKTQCIYKTADDINAGIYSVDCDMDEEEKQCLISELEQLQNSRPDSDGKLSAKGKDEIKRDIGRSPDMSDAFIMRKYFDLTHVQDDIVTAPTNDFAI